MEEPIIVQSDPKDYAFKKFIDEQKHLDCDEHRHKMKPVIHIIDKDCKGEEHLFCDKSQRNAEGKFRRPKKLMEAERRGFTSVAEMVEADKKAEEDAKKSEIDDLKKQLEALTKIIEKIPSKYRGV
jgi:polyhydroxyalkanoate synthesis regulator protein